MRFTMLSILILAAGLPVLAHHERCEPRREWRHSWEEGPRFHERFRPDDNRPDGRWERREAWREGRHWRDDDEVVFVHPRRVFLEAPAPIPMPPPVPRLHVWFGF